MRVFPKPRPFTSVAPLRILLLTVLAIGATAAAVFLFHKADQSATPRHSGNITPVLAAAGCQLQTFPSQGDSETTDLSSTFHYNSFPPSSGPHHPSRAPWGIYGNPLPQLIAVHNLADGGVAVEYGSEVKKNFYGAVINALQKDTSGLVAFPYPQLAGKLAFVAWRHVALCQPSSAVKLAAAFASFRDAYRYRGPVHLPLKEMAQGK